jgi:hypothetical protein
LTNKKYYIIRIPVHLQMPLIKPGSSKGQRKRTLFSTIIPQDRKLTRAQKREQNKRAIDNRIAFGDKKDA